jgi:hypothetical protein
MVMKIISLLMVVAISLLPVADHNDNDSFPLTPGPSPTHAGRGEKCSRIAVARY